MNVVELTKSLISCPSVTPNNEGVLDLLQKELTKMGFTCNRYLFSDTDTPDVDNLFAKIGSGAPLPIFANKLSTSGVSVSLNKYRLHVNPILVSSFWSRSKTPSLFGVTLGQEMSDFVSSTTFILYSLSKSLMDVFFLVFSSTVLTITTQYKLGFLGSSFGRLPGTTTE